MCPKEHILEGARPTMRFYGLFSIFGGASEPKTKSWVIMIRDTWESYLEKIYRFRKTINTRVKTTPWRYFSTPDYWFLWQISQKDSWSTPHLVASPQHTQGNLVNQVISLIVLDGLEHTALHTINGNCIKRYGPSSCTTEQYHNSTEMHMACVPSSLYD